MGERDGLTDSRTHHPLTPSSAEERDLFSGQRWHCQLSALDSS